MLPRINEVNVSTLSTKSNHLRARRNQKVAVSHKLLGSANFVTLTFDVNCLYILQTSLRLVRTLGPLHSSQREPAARRYRRATAGLMAADFDKTII
jgi:hypothetical protein